MLGDVMSVRVRKKPVVNPISAEAHNLKTFKSRIEKVTSLRGYLSRTETREK